jgi:hypothetical protein
MSHIHAGRFDAPCVHSRASNGMAANHCQSSNSSSGAKSDTYTGDFFAAFGVGCGLLLGRHGVLMLVVLRGWKGRVGGCVGGWGSR